MFFKRRDKKPEPTPTPAAPRPTPRPAQVMEIIYADADHERLAVGNEYNPQAYAEVKTGDSVTVELRPEPKNEYDKYAVAVILNHKRAGYLASPEIYQPQILRANRMGYRVCAYGHIELIDKAPAVRFRLCRANDLQCWLDLPKPQRQGGYVSPRFNDPVWLKRSKDYRDELVALHRAVGEKPAPVELSTEETPSGKYKGEPYIVAKSEGIVIGIIPAQYRRDTPHVFEKVESGSTAGTIIVNFFEEDDRYAAVLTVK